MANEIYGYKENYEKVEVHPKEYTSELHQDNLLINSDWKSGIINQKGKTTYSGVAQWTYCIDMWMYIGQLSIVVGSNNIKITNISSTNYLKQVVKGLESGNYTLYIDIASINGTVNLDINGTVKTIKSGVNTFVVTPSSSGNIAVQFTFASANATLTLNRLKLEKGEHFTGMPLWNETLELIKCKQYFDVRNVVLIKLPTYAGSITEQGNKFIVSNLDNIFNHDKQPSVSIISAKSPTDSVVNISGATLALGKQGLYTVTLTSNTSYTYLQAVIHLDWNNY